MYCHHARESGPYLPQSGRVSVGGCGRALLQWLWGGNLEGGITGCRWEVADPSLTPLHANLQWHSTYKLAPSMTHLHSLQNLQIPKTWCSPLSYLFNMRPKKLPPSLTSSHLSCATGPTWFPRLIWWDNKMSSLVMNATVRCWLEGNNAITGTKTGIHSDLQMSDNWINERDQGCVAQG